MPAAITGPSSIPPDEGYDAFISYSHRDDHSFGRVIHHTLETFTSPAFKSRTLRIFLDDASLPMTNDLWEEIRSHLIRSRYLVLLLSRGSAESRWVLRELNEFLLQHTFDRVGLVLTKGKTPWTDKDFHPDNNEAALTEDLINLFKSKGIEPLIVDVRDFRGRWQRWRSRWEWDNLLAAMASKIANVSKDTLFGQHITRLRRRIFMFGALSAGMAGTSLIALGFGLHC